MSRLKIATINTGSEVTRSLAFNLLSLFTIPLYLDVYGEAQFGIYFLATAFYTTLMFLDFGMEAGLRRFVAKYTANANRQELQTAVSLSLATFLVVGVLNALIILAIAPFAAHLFDVPSTFEQAVYPTFLVTAIFSVFFWLGRFSRAVLEGYQLHYLRNLNQYIQLIGLLALYFWVRIEQIPFLWFIIATFSIRILPIFLDSLLVLYKRLLQDIRLYPKIQKADLKSDFFSFSKDMLILTLIALFAREIDKLVVGTILSAAMVTAYVIIVKPIGIMKMINSVTFSAIAPMIAKEYEANNTTFIKKVLIKGSQFHFFLITPLPLLNILFLDYFLDLWIGPRYAHLVIWGQIGGLIFFCYPFYSALYRTLIYTGKTKACKRVDSVTTLINFVVSIIATYFIGIGGVIVGTVVQAIINIFAYYPIGKKEFDYRITSFLVPNTILNYIWIIALTVLLYYILLSLDISSWLHFFTLLLISTASLYAYGFYSLLIKQGMLTSLIKQFRS